MKLLILCAALLTGCSTVLPAPKVLIPSALTQECPQLNQLGGTTGADLLKNITDNAALYHACADAKHALNEAVKSQ